MKTIVLILSFCVVSTGLWGESAQAPTPEPVMPENITLTNGAVLHDISVVRWNSDSVVLKHTGGADSIRFTYIAEPDRTAVLAVRDASKRAAHAASKDEAPPDHDVKGQVFIATQGGVNYKLGDVTVYLLRIDDLNQFQTATASVHLSKPVATTVTDADGNYSLIAPDDSDYFVFAQASRRVGEQIERYEWRQPLTGLDRKHVQLSVSNLIDYVDHKVVVFDE